MTRPAGVGGGEEGRGEGEGEVEGEEGRTLSFRIQEERKKEKYI